MRIYASCLTIARSQKPNKIYRKNCTFYRKSVILQKKCNFTEKSVNFTEKSANKKVK